MHTQIHESKVAKIEADIFITKMKKLADETMKPTFVFYSINIYICQ